MQNNVASCRVSSCLISKGTVLGVYTIYLWFGSVRDLLSRSTSSGTASSSVWNSSISSRVNARPIRTVLVRFHMEPFRYKKGHILTVLYTSPFQYRSPFSKIEKSFDYFVSYGKSDTVCFQGSKYLLQQTWSVCIHVGDLLLTNRLQLLTMAVGSNFETEMIDSNETDDQNDMTTSNSKIILETLEKLRKKKMGQNLENVLKLCEKEYRWNREETRCAIDEAKIKSAIEEVIVDGKISFRKFGQEVIFRLN